VSYESLAVEMRTGLDAIEPVIDGLRRISRASACRDATGLARD
jgi:hypothetical protein